MPGLYKNQLKRKRPTLNSSVIHEESVFHSTAISDDTTVDEPQDVITNENDMDVSISPIKRPALGEGVLSPVAGPSSSISTAVVQNKVVEPLLVVERETNSQQDMFQRNDRDFPEDEGSEGSQRMHHSTRYGPVVINPPCGHMYFASILHKNGFILALPKNHLLVNVFIFRKKLEEWLTQNDNENSRIETETCKFMKAMENYFAEKENLRHSCTTTMNDKEYIQPSLLHCLMGVKFLQVRLRRVITPVLSEAAYSSSHDDAEFVGTIMSQLKWLPTLVEGKTFAQGLMDIFQDASIPVQKQMVRFLPEIFLPEFHPDLIPTLMATFDIGTQVNVPMLDCFSTLVVPETDCLRIRRSAVDKMASAPLADLPAYLAFLFRVGSEVSHLEEGINEMREKLEINSSSPKGKNNQNDAEQFEIVERIRFCVSVNPLIIKLWISKIKDDLNCGLELKTLDLIMLLIFVEARDKSANKTLHSLFCDGPLINKLFDKMIECNKPMVNNLFPTIASFIDEVFRSKDTKCQIPLTDIVKKVFVCVGPMRSDHLMTNLLGVLINGHPSCREVVLKTLTKIAESEPKKLLYFHHHLMGALVYVIKFPPRQMQALMNILAILAFVSEDHRGQENTFTAEFMILLRKQITNTYFQTRCFGVLGTIAAVKQLAIQPPVDDEKITELLELAWDSTEKDEEACGIFFDELAKCADILPMDICRRFRDSMKAKFEAMWTLDQASDSQLLRSSRGQAGLQLAPAFDANKEMERDQLIIILEPEALQMSPLVIPSHLKVMAELERKSENGALEGVDAVLGCPILFPKLSTYYEQETLDDFNYNQKTHLGQYLVLTINYFRECVSAFVESDNPELRIKVWLRLNNIVTLQKILVTHFDSFPNLPAAYGAESTMMANSSGAGFSGALNIGRRPGTANASKRKPKSAAQPKKKKASNKKKGKKGKKASDEDEEEVEDEDDEDGPTIDVSCRKINLENIIQPKAVLPHLRRLGCSVFNLLKYPLKISANPVDYSGILLNLSNATQSSSTMEQIETFTPETLALLLVEIKQQATDQNQSFDLLSVNELLNSFCSHVDTISAQYQSATANQQIPMESCLRLLMKSMTLYTDTVANLKDKDRRTLLTDQAILTLAARYKSCSQEIDEEELPTQVELLANVSKYLSNFKDMVGPGNYEAAEDHVKLLKAVHDMLPRQDHLKKAIDETMRFYLRRAWTPKLPSGVIEFFLKTWLAVTPSPVKIVKHLTKHLIWSDDDQQPIPNCNVYKSCSKVNFHTWYGALFTGLAHHVHKSGRRRGDYEDSIEFWAEAIELFKMLVLVTRTLQHPLILFPLLKYSRVYIEAFISGGVCLLPQLWNQEDTAGVNAAKALTKSLQDATRCIQNICEHSKVLKDDQLMRLVPLLKKVLETLVFRVRDALADYGAAGAFWMGSLKHRNLEGHVISSQVNTTVNEEESESDSNDDGADDNPISRRSGLLPDIPDDEDANDDDDDASPQKEDSDSD